MKQESPVALPEDYMIIRYPEVVRMTGLCRTSITRLIAAGKFPQAVQLSDSGTRQSPVGFVFAEVKAWVSQKIAKREKTPE